MTDFFLKSYRNETHILVADQNQKMLNSLAKILMVFAYTVAVASSEDVVLSLVSDNTKKFDLIIMDVGLAYANESFLFHEIKMNIPIILMSDDYDSMAAKEALQNGAFIYLAKPIGLHTVINLWQHGMRAKFLNDNVKYIVKRVIEIESDDDETEIYGNQKAANLNKRSTKETINGYGTDKYLRKRRINQKQVTSSVQKRHRGPKEHGMIPIGCMLENCPQKNMERFSGNNIDTRIFSENMEPISTNLKEVNVLHPPSSSNIEESLEQLLVPSSVNNVHFENDFNQFFDNDLGIIDDFNSIFENVEPFSTNFGTNNDVVFEDDFNNLIIPNDVEGTSNEVVNNQMIGEEDLESFPYGDNSLLFDEPAGGY